MGPDEVAVVTGLVVAVVVVTMDVGVEAAVEETVGDAVDSMLPGAAEAQQKTAKLTRSLAAAARQPATMVGTQARALAGARRMIFGNLSRAAA